MVVVSRQTVLFVGFFFASIFLPSIPTVLLRSYVMAENAKDLEIRQYERLVRMIEQKEVRQRAALADTQLQLQGARNALETAKKGK